MSKLAKILIPLIADKTTKENYTKDAGFIDLYTFDMDKYKNFQGVYLMFKSDVFTEASKSSSINLNKQPGIIDVYTKIIKGTPYIIYSFAKDDFIKKIINSNTYYLDADQMLKILSFWGTDDKFSKDMLTNGGMMTYCSEAPLPENDMQISFVEHFINRGIIYNKRETA